MMKMFKRQEGFTLVEMLIVIAILGILAAIAVPKFIDMSKVAQVKGCHSNAASIDAAIEMYTAKNGKAPAAAADAKTELCDNADTKVMDAINPCPVAATNVYAIVNKDGNGMMRAKCGADGYADGTK